MVEKQLAGHARNWEESFPIGGTAYAKNKRWERTWQCSWNLVSKGARRYSVMMDRRGDQNLQSPGKEFRFISKCEGSHWWV